MIKKHQIKSLNKASEYKGIISGFILNFRKTNNTYFLSIKKFNEMIINLNKKSFNESDVKNMDAILIEQKLKKVHYKYNIEKFISYVQGLEN